MGLTISQKIIKEHLLEGKLTKGQEISLKIDQTLTQDATGTVAYLQLEAMGIDKVKTELSVSYVDHNTIQGDFKNADDHIYLQTVAAKYGLWFSRAGNGICHQLHLERFAKPSKTLLGSDSHTPTAGGLGALAMGSGGLDVALAMAGSGFRIRYPKILGIELKGKLQNWVSAKDVILHVLKIIDVKGGRGYIVEYFGEGIETLSVPDRATITNMGTETGCTTSIFPSDNITREFLKSQNREHDWVELLSDSDAKYDKTIIINLAKVEPLAACPHSPGAIKLVSDLAKIDVQQVGIGSCTNSSLRDLSIVGDIFRGKTISPNLHVVMNPGSRQVVEHLIKDGKYTSLVKSGVRFMENACGACIGMGAAPRSASVSVRTYNRNFLGRSGTKDASVYLVSPETAAATALTGKITDPRTLKMSYPVFRSPKKFSINDNMFIPPSKQNCVNVLRGPNIVPLPEFKSLPNLLKGKVLLKLQDNITTDHIMPAGASILPFRSNIPEISKFVFATIDKYFYRRALENKGGFILAGENYGQGSSREHAALAPKYLGVKAVIAKSFARIHLANLINFGIVPLTFIDSDDYQKINLEDELTIEIGTLVKDQIFLITNSKKYELTHTLSELDAKILMKGGKLAFIKARHLD